MQNVDIHFGWYLVSTFGSLVSFYWQVAAKRPGYLKKVAPQFLLMWSCFGTRVIRDMTLHSAPSFGTVFSPLRFQEEQFCTRVKKKKKKWRSFISFHMYKVGEWLFSRSKWAPVEFEGSNNGDDSFWEGKHSGPPHPHNPNPLSKSSLYLSIYHLLW